MKRKSTNNLYIKEIHTVLLMFVHRNYSSMTKLQLLLVVMIFSSLASSAQFDWQALPSAPTSPYRFDDIYFLNPKIGWAVKPIAAPVINLGQIWETRDGGMNWKLNHDSSQTYYRCVGFADSLNGWIGNLADTTISNDTIPLYSTHDGGKTLQPINLPYPRPKGICGISVVTDSVVYAYGRYYGPPVLAMTKDKGKTWVTKDMSPYASVGLIDGWFWSKDTGFITGQNGANSVILHTVDGGNTWQTVYQATRGDTDHVWKIFFPSRNIGYGSIEYTGKLQGYQTTYKTYFTCTTDGGKTWVEKPFITGYDEEGCGFINDSTGWIGGWSGMNYITTNWGNTWKIDSSFAFQTLGQYSPEPYVNRFRRFGDTIMYAGGNTIYKLDTRITGISELKNTNAFVSNYPNPFTDKTTITYILQRPCRNVVIDIYNAQGQKASSKNLGFKNVGQNNYVFNEDLPAGVYYYSITTSDIKMCKKMIIIK